MLQAGWKEQPQIGGKLTPQLMTPPIPSPSRSSRTSSRSNTYSRSDEAQEARIPSTEIGSNVCE
jgi:hypothetical protein